MQPHSPIQPPCLIQVRPCLDPPCLLPADWVLPRCAGKVELSRKEIAQLIGKVFLQKAAVNLLSTVLDTPEFFWSAPDSMQTLYKKVCEYMELEERVEVLNNRFQVLFRLGCEPGRFGGR